MILEHGTIKRIHVDQHAIRRNKTAENPDPPISVKTSKGNHKVFEAEVLGPSKLVYSPDKPLDCGAHLWIETKAAIGLKQEV